MVLSLAWYWQMRDLRTEARHWSTAAGALGPDPFLPPAEAAPRRSSNGSRTPRRPWRPSCCRRRGACVALIRMVFMNRRAGRLEHPGEPGVAAQRHHGLHARTCRRPAARPASLWFFAVVMTGDIDGLKDLLDETVRACRAYGYEWELAGALQHRANILANRDQLGR